MGTGRRRVKKSESKKRRGGPGNERAMKERKIREQDELLICLDKIVIFFMIRQKGYQQCSVA